MASCTLTWNPSETGITEIKSYTIFRNVDGGLYAQLAVCPVLRDFLGGIIGVQGCTLATPPEHPKDPWTNVIEDSPVTYVDATVIAGHTYCYYVTAQPLGNNQSTAQGSDSTPSNIQCILAANPVGVPVQLYSAWSPFALIVGDFLAFYTPGTAAVQAGLPKPFLVVIGQLVSGDDPVFTYGSTPPVASLGQANGAGWMYIFDLTLHAPVSPFLQVIGPTDFSAAVFYGVNSFQTHASGYFPARPYLDAWPVVPAGSCLVGMTKCVHSATPTLVSDDAAALTSVLEGDPYNNGTIVGKFQFPANAAVTLTSNSAPGPLDNAVSCLLSP